MPRPTTLMLRAELICRVGVGTLSAEVVMARQPEVFVRSLKPAKALRLVKIMRAARDRVGCAGPRSCRSWGPALCVQPAGSAWLRAGLCPPVSISSAVGAAGRPFATWRLVVGS